TPNDTSGLGVGDTTGPTESHETTPRVSGRFLTRMNDGSTFLFDPSGPGVEFLGSMTNTAHPAFMVVGREGQAVPPQLSLELALYGTLGTGYLAWSGDGPRTGGVFQGRKVTATEAAAEFIKDGLPVPPGLPLPADALSPAQGIDTSGTKEVGEIPQVGAAS